jgi:hypothetical protein
MFQWDTIYHWRDLFQKLVDKCNNLNCFGISSHYKYLEQKNMLFFQQNGVIDRLKTNTWYDQSYPHQFLLSLPQVLDNWSIKASCTCWPWWWNDHPGCSSKHSCFMYPNCSHHLTKFLPSTMMTVSKLNLKNV